MPVDTALPMTRIPFVELRFPPEGPSQAEIQSRLRRHYQRLRARRDGIDPPMRADGRSMKQAGWTVWMTLISPGPRGNASSAAPPVWQRDQRPSPASSTSPGKTARGLRYSVKGQRLIRIPSEHRADEIAAEIHADMSWMARATETPRRM